MILPVEPVAKPRMTRRDRWANRPVVVKYHEFCDRLRESWERESPTPEPESNVTLKFYISMPKSWSKKKRLDKAGQPHQVRPDIDNLVKAFLDALCDNDSYVYHVNASKYWSNEGFIVVE